MITVSITEDGRPVEVDIILLDGRPLDEVVLAVLDAVNPQIATSDQSSPMAGEDPTCVTRAAWAAEPATVGPRPGLLTPVCQVPDCGCSGDAHP